VLDDGRHHRPLVPEPAEPAGRPACLVADLPPADADWRQAMRRRAVSARTGLRRHPWATPLIESRANPGPATLRHHDAVLGTLRRAGFSVEMAAHADSLLDSTSRQLHLRVRPGGGRAAVRPRHGPRGRRGILARFPPDEYPYLAELTREHVLRPGYDSGDEFEFGLELILHGLERRRTTADARDR
jgi:Tetracyclin repressor-like, C-terminal domain